MLILKLFYKFVEKLKSLHKSGVDQFTVWETHMMNIINI